MWDKIKALAGIKDKQPEASEDAEQAGAVGAEQELSAEQKKAAAKAEKKEKKKDKKPLIPFFVDAEPPNKNLVNEDKENQRMQSMMRRVKLQGILIIVFTLVFILSMPFFGIQQIYYARRIGEPIGGEKVIYGLESPNLTQKAILSWATTTATEVMTFNFANYNQRISMFSDRFLEESWPKFVDALLSSSTITKFKERNLVLTAAPSGPALMVDEYDNIETNQHEYKVSVPLVLKYVTNNNKSQISQTTVNMTLVRVSTLVNPFGIAIKVWSAR